MRRRNAFPSLALPPKREIRHSPEIKSESEPRECKLETRNCRCRVRFGIKKGNGVGSPTNPSVLPKRKNRWKNPLADGDGREITRGTRGNTSAVRARKFQIRKQPERNAGRVLRCDKSTMRASCFKARCTLARLDTLAFAYMQRTAANCTFLLSAERT